jgi:hypothetical protein
MNLNEMLQQFRAERDKLDAAIKALAWVGGGKRRGRPPGSANKPAATTAAPAGVAMESFD